MTWEAVSKIKVRRPNYRTRSLSELDRQASDSQVIMDAAGIVLATSRHSLKHETYAALYDSSRVPTSTLWHREHGRPSKREVAAQKQYLTPSEEKALAEYILRWAEQDFPAPVKLV
jgi:hypothetical protein